MTTPQTPQLPPLPEHDAVFYCSEETGYLTQYRRPPANLTEGDTAMYEAETVQAYARAALEAQKAELVSECDSPPLCRALGHCAGQYGDKKICAAQPQAQKAAAPDVAGSEVPLNIIRFWPDGFQDRLEQVWLDLVGFIPNYKLHDLQKVMAEFGFTMKVYETGLPAGTASDGGEG
jgi:hypothetical protein